MEIITRKDIIRPWLDQSRLKLNVKLKISAKFDLKYALVKLI